jgi:hypothetical protein
MRTINFYSFYCLLVSLLFVTSLSAQSSQSFSKSFDLSGSAAISLDLAGTVSTQTWNEKYVKITITVQLPNAPSSTLSGLIQAGRYNLVGVEKGDSFFINSPGVGREIKVNGNALKEKISYIIYVPNGVNLVQTQLAQVEK